MPHILLSLPHKMMHTWEKNNVAHCFRSSAQMLPMHAKIMAHH
jgi:hypothetical protein